MGKVKDFLGVISEANKRLKQDAKDLVLGIADLHTSEAIAAAESAISSGQPLVSLDSDSSETESEGTSDDDDETSSEDDDEKTCSSLKHKKSNSGEDGSSQAVGKNGSKKRPKIVEMC